MSWRAEASGMIRAALRPALLARSARVAAVVGTLLSLVNHPELLTTPSFDPALLARVIVTYLVPFCVATWSAAAQANARDQER